MRNAVIRTGALARISVALSAVLAVVSVVWQDWMWLIIDLVCIVMLVMPFRRSFDYYYNRRVVWMTIVTPVLAAALYIIHDTLAINPELMDVSSFTYVSAAIQSYQCFTIGFMFAVVMDRSFGLTMTRIWILVFAVTFAMCMSALDMFFTFGQMYAEGYPVFNEDFFDNDRYTNGIMMATPVVATFVSLASFIWAMRTTRGMGKGSFVTGRDEL